ncbi:MAG: alginate export family protein [Burkholderiales bacterium]
MSTRRKITERFLTRSILLGFAAYAVSANADQSTPAYPATPPAAADANQPSQAASLSEAIKDGQLLLDLRPRYEYVDQDNKPEEADAITLRTLLGWKTKPFLDLSATVQFIDVSHIGDDDFNDTENGKIRFPTVADPEETDVNLLYLDYSGLPDTRVRLGRQGVVLDNQRFIGNVGFRQVMQVFNGVTVENKGLLPNTELYAGYLGRIRNIFAQEKEADIWIARAAYDWSPGNKLIAYSYLHDQEKTVSNTGLDDSSNRILGVRADGAYPIKEDVRLLYTAEYAHQDDYEDGNSLIDAGYWHLGIGAGLPQIYGRIDYEKLESNDGKYAFQTPLGTNHAFQGWADLFLTTPKTGIEDWYGTVGAKAWGIDFFVSYHEFESDTQSIDFGSEWDAAITYPIPFLKGLTAKLEYADFDKDDVVAGNATTDTQKFWFTVNYVFGAK